MNPNLDPDDTMTPFKAAMHLVFIAGLMVALYFTARWLKGGQP